MCERPRPRTPSTRDGTCSASAEQAIRSGGTPAREPAPLRARDSCDLGLGAREPSLLHQLAKRLLDARLALARGQLAGVGACDHHEVMAIRQFAGKRPKSIA